MPSMRAFNPRDWSIFHCCHLTAIPIEALLTALRSTMAFRPCIHPPPSSCDQYFQDTKIIRPSYELRGRDLSEAPVTIKLVSTPRRLAESRVSSPGSFQLGHYPRFSPRCPDSSPQSRCTSIRLIYHNVPESLRGTQFTGATDRSFESRSQSLLVDASGLPLPG